MNPKDTTNAVNDDAAHDETPDTPVESVDEQPTDGSANDETEKSEPSQALPPPEKILTLEKQTKEYLDGWMRERADFANYKKRVDAQLRDSAQNATIDALVNLIPIIDDFERAMANVPAELAGNPWLNGITMIQRKFQKMLDDQGVTIIDPVGESFDPSRHEAVTSEDSSEVASGHVIATLQKGYLHGERVLRPALVKVAN